MSDLDSVLYTKEYFLQDNICRFCWTKDATINCALKSPLFFKVEYCLNIDLSQDNSEYCPKVCQNCFHKIEHFYAFKTFCQNTNNKFNKILNNDLDTSAISKEISNEEIKPENIESIPNIDFDGFLNSPQSSESSLENIVESPKNSKGTEVSSQNNPCTKKGEKLTNSRRKKCSTYCNICCENFFNENTFIKHNSEAHGIEKDGKFKCFGCGKLYKQRSSRLSHEAHICKELENGYKCSLCSKYLSTRGVYEKHMKNHRLNNVVGLPEDNIFKCIKCGKQFTKKGDWKAHREEHTTKKEYICETCGRVFTHRAYLILHNVTHTGDKRYECAHCGFKCSQKNNLTIHIRKHTKERPFQCDLCPQRCVSKSNLLAHRRCHLGLKSFQCPYTDCDKKFGYKLSLKEHIAVTHEGTASNPCPYCSLVYARRRHLRRHLQNKHPDEFKDMKEYTTQSTSEVSNSNPNGKCNQ